VDRRQSSGDRSAAAIIRGIASYDMKRWSRQDWAGSVAYFKVLCRHSFPRTLRIVSVLAEIITGHFANISLEQYFPV
jgi:hypothetical protein